MNSIVALSAYNFLKLFYQDSSAGNVLIFALFFYAQIIITELAAGIFNRLTPGSLIILNLIILFSAIALKRKGLPRREQLIFKEAGLLRNKMAVFLLSCIIGFALVKAAVNLVNAPFGWDSLNYHFSFAVEWLKNKNLANPMVINCDPSPPYYPINGSLIFLWLMLPFRDVFLADIGQLPFFILSFIAVFSIARKIGIAGDYSYFSAALFVLIPNFFKQLEIAYVDVIFCAFFLLTVNFLLALEQEFNFKNLLLSALSFGLLTGVKNTALPLGGILLLFFILIALSKKIYRKIIPYSLFFGFVALVFGGFSYIRNFILTGNFLYPVNFYIFGRKIFPGVLDISYYRAHYLPGDYGLSKMLFHEGLGAQTLVLILPALFISLPFTLLRKGKKANIVFIYFLLIPFLMYFISRFFIPLIAVRYIYPALALGLVIAFYCIEAAKVNRKAVYILTALCAVASLAELARRAQITASVLLAALAYAAIVYYRRAGLSKKNKIALAVSGGALSIFLLLPLQKDYLRNEFSRYITPVMAKRVFWRDAAVAWHWLNSQTAAPLQIAYAGRPVPFPLYGTHFKNNVYYASVNKNLPLLHAYPGGNYRRKKDYRTLHSNLSEPGNYRENPDYNAWLNNLLQRNTDYLFIYSLHQTKDIEFGLEQIWAGAHPERFEPVFGNESIRIYKIRK